MTVAQRKLWKFQWLAFWGLRLRLEGWLRRGWQHTYLWRRVIAAAAFGFADSNGNRVKFMMLVHMQDTDLDNHAECQNRKLKIHLARLMFARGMWMQT